MRQNQKPLAEKGLKRALKIGKAAAKIFNKKGFLQTNMDDIAVAAKTSKGGIYHYFSSKDELLFFILNTYLDLILKDLDLELGKIKDSFSKIQFIICRHIGLYTNNLAESKILLHEAHCLPSKYYKTIAAKERKYYQIVSDVLSGFFGGQIGRDRLPVITFLLFGMCNWIYFWYDPKGVVNPEELSKHIWTVFLKGVSELKES